MADEAILRIILEAAASASGLSAADLGGAGGGGSGSRGGRGAGGFRQPSAGAEAFDPFVEATKNIERRRKAQEVKAAESILTGTGAVPPFKTTEQDAKKKLAAEERAAEVNIAVAALRTPEQIEKQAEANLAAARHTARVNAAVAGLRTDDDVKSEADARLTAARHTARVNAAVIALKTDDDAEQEARNHLAAAQHQKNVAAAIIALRTPEMNEDDAVLRLHAEKQQHEVALAVAAMRTPEMIEKQAEAMLAAEESRAKVQEAVLNLRTPEMIEEQAKRLAAAAEYQDRVRAKLAEIRPPAVEEFDPRLEAMRKRNQEINRQRIKDEYERMYGKQEEKQAGLFQTIASHLPGRLGNVVRSVSAALSKIGEGQASNRQQAIPAIQRPKTQPPSAQQTPPPQAKPAFPTLAPTQGQPPKPPVAQKETAPIAPQPPSGGGVAEASVRVAAAGATFLAVQAVGKAVVGVFNGLVDTTVQAAGAVGDFAVRLASASADVSQLPDMIGDVANGLGNLADSISSAVEGFGIFTAAVGASIAVFTGFTGIGLVVGGAIVAIGALTTTFGMAGKALAGFGKIVGETFKAVAGLIREIEGSADRYAQYNPEIAYAKAMADLRLTLGDMRRAQEAGPALAQYLHERANLQDRYEDAKVQFMNAIMPHIIHVMEYLEALIETIKQIREAWGASAPAAAQDGEGGGLFGAITAVALAVIPASINQGMKDSAIGAILGLIEQNVERIRRQNEQKEISIDFLNEALDVMQQEFAGMGGDFNRR